MSTKAFLSRYWQKKLLLIRNAFPGFSDPLSPEELAGIACEPEAEARLVFTRKKDWELKSSPFTEKDFTSLPASKWTLLVQAVDQWVPEVKELLRSVDFIPSWRVDDVMVSYATQGGGVGPHFDHYDVFLVQGQGSRTWRTGQRCTSQDIVRGKSGLKLLREFHCENEWTLETGDVLYVPPGVAHWGVSRDDSLCYSIGFRAPSLGEMLLSVGDALNEALPADERYTDPQPRLPLASGEIGGAALRRAKGMLKEALSDDEALARWFGRHMTEPKYPELVQPADEVPNFRRASLMLAPNPASRFAWQRRGRQLLVFADGECFEFPSSAAMLELAQSLCRPNARIPVVRYREEGNCHELLKGLFVQGSLLTGS